LLRCCGQLPQLSGARLAWTWHGDWVAILHTPADCSPDQLVTALVERQRRRSESGFLTWDDDIKVQPEVLVAQLLAAQQSADRLQRELADFLAAFASELVTDKTAKRNVKPTAFHMTAGQQKFLKSARELAVSLDPLGGRGKRQRAGEHAERCAAAFSEAIFGPWRYQDKMHALGWDPSTEALHAHSAIAPTDARPSSVRAAVWLAFESLPLFPCFANGRRLVTTGFDRDSNWLTWPIWDTPISLFTLRSLLAAAFDDPETLAMRGVAAIYRARRVTTDKGQAMLKPSTLADW